MNTEDPVTPPVTPSIRVHTELPATGAPAATDAAATGDRNTPPTRVRASTSRYAPHTMTLNASNGLPADFVPLRPSADNTRERKPLTGAVTDGALTAGRLRVGAVASGGPPAGTHPDVTDAAASAVEPRDGRRSAHRGTSAAAVPEPSPPGRPPRPTRVSTLTPATAPGTTGEVGTEEESAGTDADGAELPAEEPTAVLARSETPPATDGPRGVRAESPREAPPPVPGSAPRPPRRTGADGRDVEPSDVELTDPDPPADPVASEPDPPADPLGSAKPTAGANPTPTPTPNATASAPTRPTNWAALRGAEPESIA